MTGPIEVIREYRPAASGEVVYTKTLTSSATPSKSDSSGRYVPTGTETINQTNIESLSRSITNDAGEVIQRDNYYSMTSITYSTSSKNVCVRRTPRRQQCLSINACDVRRLPGIAPASNV